MIVHWQSFDKIKGQQKVTENNKSYIYCWRNSWPKFYSNFINLSLTIDRGNVTVSYSKGNDEIILIDAMMFCLPLFIWSSKELEDFVNRRSNKK